MEILKKTMTAQNKNLIIVSNSSLPCAVIIASAL